MIFGIYGDNQFLAHWFAGMFLAIFGVIGFIESVHSSFTQKHRATSMFIVGCIFTPIAMGAEFFTIYQRGHVESMNIHHLTLYGLILIDAVLIYMCDLRSFLSCEWRYVNESMLLFCAGALFFAHNDGGDLFNGFHQLMFPGLLFAAILHFICEFKRTNKLSGLKMFRGLWVSMMGTFFMNIGPGFFWDHGYGYLGNSMDNVGMMKTWGTLTHTFSLHFIAWSTIYTIMYAYLSVNDKAKVDVTHQNKFSYNAVKIDEDDDLKEDLYPL